MENDDDVSLVNIELTCKNCGWQGLSQNCDKAIDRGEGHQVRNVCPRCKAQENFKEGYDVK